MKKLSPTVSTAPSLREWVAQSGHGPQIEAALAEGSVLMVGKFPDVPMKEELQAEPAVDTAPPAPSAPKFSR